MELRKTNVLCWVCEEGVYAHGDECPVCVAREQEPDYIAEREVVTAERALLTAARNTPKDSEDYKALSLALSALLGHSIHNRRPNLKAVA